MISDKPIKLPDSYEEPDEYYSDELKDFYKPAQNKNSDTAERIANLEQQIELMKKELEQVKQTKAKEEEYDFGF